MQSTNFVKGFYSLSKILKGRPWSNSLRHWQPTSNRGGDRRSVGSLLPSSGNIAAVPQRPRTTRRYVFLLLPASPAYASSSMFERRAGHFNSNVKCSRFRSVLSTGRLEMSKAVTVCKQAPAELTGSRFLSSEDPLGNQAFDCIYRRNEIGIAGALCICASVKR